MRKFVAVVLGAFSGFLVYAMGLMIFVGPDGKGATGPIAAFVLFIVGWIASSWLLLRDADSTAKVFSRGFLLGATEWLAMIGIGAVFMIRMGGQDAGGIASVLTGAFSFFMALVCLTCFVVSYFWNRTMKSTQPNQ